MQATVNFPIKNKSQGNTYLPEVHSSQVGSVFNIKAPCNPMGKPWKRQELERKNSVFAHECFIHECFIHTSNTGRHVCTAKTPLPCSCAAMQSLSIHISSGLTKKIENLWHWGNVWQFFCIDFTAGNNKVGTNRITYCKIRVITGIVLLVCGQEQAVTLSQLEIGAIRVC